MKVGIHQPQYIPWIPYFAKIRQSEVFVLLDDVQFQKNGLQNRNHILSSTGELLLTLPVSVHLGDPINTVRIHGEQAVSKQLKTIRSVYGKAPYFSDVFPMLENVLQSNNGLLVGIAVPLITQIAGYLELTTRIIMSSALSKEGTASDLILSICKGLGASTYLSGSGGADYLDLESFRSSGIVVEFQEYKFHQYRQFNNKAAFIPKLSILDLLFNEGKNSINFI